MGVGKEDEEPLDVYQKRALSAFKLKNHLAILGGAGTGKSILLSKIISTVSSMFAKYEVVACAMTNNAARSIDGITFHKFLEHVV